MVGFRLVLKKIIMKSIQYSHKVQNAHYPREQKLFLITLLITSPLQKVQARIKNLCGRERL